jgi:hypothetical protein
MPETKPDPLEHELFETVATLAALKRVEPLEVAAILGRRAELEEEDEYRCIYALTGACETPVAQAWATWLKKLDKGFIVGDVALDIPMPRAVARFGEAFAPIFPDAGAADELAAYAWPVAAGELRLMFPDYHERYLLSRFAVTQVPWYDWSELRP